MVTNGNPLRSIAISYAEAQISSALDTVVNRLRHIWADWGIWCWFSMPLRFEILMVDI